MLRLVYEVVTRNGKQTRVRYFTYITSKMSSEILPKLLDSIFKVYPHERLIYAKLYKLVKNRSTI